MRIYIYIDPLDIQDVVPSRFYGEVVVGVDQHPPKKRPILM